MADRPRIAVLMDPLDSIKPKKDSTLAMMLAAQRRGIELLYLEQQHLWVRDGIAMARLRTVTIRDDAHDWYSLGPVSVAPLSSVDAVLMRKDPPFDTEYIYTTYLLERAEAAGCLIVNRPQGLRDMNEKVYTAWFPECCAPTLITRDMSDMAAFLAEHGRAVCKPLYGMGGRSIFVLEQGDKNANVVFETLTDYGSRYAIVQRYIPDIVTTGDSRVLMVDGEPIPYALARIPTPQDNRGNLAAGAQGLGRPLNDRDRWLTGRIGPVLRERGMMFVGLDVIGGFVTEINVTSPTGIRELDRQYGIDIAGSLIDAILSRLTTRSRPLAASAGR
jgi:glutathione synthase